MNRWNLRRFALTNFVAVVLLTGCGGSQPPIGAPGAIPQSGAIVSQVKRGGSWMRPKAKSSDLLYVSGVGHSGHTNLYAYPKGRLVTRIQVDGSALCSNTRGDVFFGQTYGTAEYPHGSATQLTFIDAPFGSVYSCSVDPTTGNLAVYIETNSKFGIAIYRPLKRGRWNLLHTYIFAQVQHACSYDSAGNLFVAGFTSSRQLSLEELPKGGSKFETITLDKNVSPQGSMQWDGRYLAIGDFGNMVIHRFAMRGTKGKQIGSLTLSDAAYIRQFWIQNNIIIGPEMLKPRVVFWRYPQGGKPVKHLRVTLSGGNGVTVSVAPR